jgi:hypothetical protein
MLKKRVLHGGLAMAGAALLLALAATGPAVAQQSTMYRVTVANLTSGQPFTPPVVAAHSDALDAFEMGEAASAEVQQIAENGNLDPMLELLGGSSAVVDYVAGDAPVMPGESASLTIEARPGTLLSVVSMLICTNDGFTGVDSLELPASGSVSVDANAYDAGTETNTEDFADLVPPCQALVGVMSDDEGTGMSNPDLAEGGVVSPHDGIQGGTDLTVADHGWSDPVARITVEAVDGLPPSGTGPVEGGGLAFWPFALAAAGAALLAFGGLSVRRAALARSPR